MVAAAADEERSGSDTAVRILANANKQPYVDLYWSNLYDEGVQRVAKTLQRDQSITGVGLGMNYISPMGAQAVSVCLMVNRTLRQMHLPNNHFGDKGTIAIAGALTENDVLEEIDLRDCMVRWFAMREVANLCPFDPKSMVVRIFWHCLCVGRN